MKEGSTVTTVKGRMVTEESVTVLENDKRTVWRGRDG